MDCRWRRSAADEVMNAGGCRYLDVCTGTGEMAELLHRLSDDDTGVWAVDFSREMLSVAARKHGNAVVRFVRADVCELPFPAETFDAAVISFALRNLNRNPEALLDYLREVRRVLAPGGRLVILETSQPGPGLVRKLFHLYVGLAVRPVGRLIAGSKAGYDFLATSIVRFYDPATLSELLERAGYSDVRFRRKMFGAVAVHTAFKQ